MDEQRLERALRAGPPFATAYLARPLPLATRPRTTWGLALPRIAVMLAVLALLLAATIIGALLSGLVPSPAAVVIRDPGPERSYTISIVTSDGREETIFPQGTRAPVYIDDLAWSDDGQLLAFTAARRRTGLDDIPKLYVMRSDGSDLRELTTLGRACPWSSAGNMRWAPDGSAIAVCTGHEYATSAATTGRSGRAELLIVDVASGASTTVASEDTLLEYFGPFRWSLDSRWVAYRTQASGNALSVVRRDGSGRQQLANPAAPSPANGPADVAAFAWSPDSDAIALGDPDAPAAIEIVRLDGVQSSISLASVEPNDTTIQVLAWTGDDELIYLAAGGRVVAMTSVDGTTGEVLLTWDASEAPAWLSPEGGIDWSRAPWVLPDGRTLNWWQTGERGTCLMAAADGEVEQEFCIDTGSAAGRDAILHAVGEHP